jgi:signal transduction histidine kinase/phage shock protein PspC (stress-responsive transcriptional regulator)
VTATRSTRPVYWQYPVLADDDRLVAGVSAGIGREIGVAPIWVRAGFVVLFAVGGWGVVLYGVAWAAMAVVSPRYPHAAPVPKGRSARQRVIGLGAIVFGTASLFGQVGGFPGDVVVSVGMIGGGALLAWQQLSLGVALRRRPLRWILIIVGFLLVVGSVPILFQQVGQGDDGAVIAGGATAVIALISAPWWWRLVRERDGERQARIRSEERAELAAHLHDSVLQTLSLIQRNSEDPQKMLNLARRQERELRNWLDPDRASRRGGSIRGQLDEIATNVEELHGVPVEVVAVGDCLIDARLDALLGATREATVNAAKHSGAERIDVYVEVTEQSVEIFVRDTGKGFDPQAVADDRRGVRHSIVGRMERAGGSAVITSAPGDGTEVELRLERPGSQ